MAKTDRKQVLRLLATGRTLTLARTPNSGFLTPPRLPEDPRELPFRDGDLQAWPDMGDNRVIMLLRWHTGVNSIREVDEKARLAYLKKPQPGIVVVPPRYYVENVKALLDTAREWYFDKKRRQVSLIPPDDIPDPNEADIVVPKIEQLLIIKGERKRPVRNLRFYGLHFEATNPTGPAIQFEYTHQCELVGSDIRGIGGTAVLVGKGCYQTRILGNHIRAADRGGITVRGDAHPQDWADIIRETIVSHNTLSDCGGTTIYAANTLYTTISHNEISHNRGRYAISVGGWSNLEEAIDYGYRVEYNHIHDVQKYADDSGAIKTAGMTHDSYIRHNLVHDVKAGYFNDNVGFWFDNMSLGWVSEYNIFYNLEQGEMKLCAANLVDNIYRDNFVIEPPEIAPERIIDGEPRFEFGELTIKRTGQNHGETIRVGEALVLSARVYNAGATGLQKIELNVDGRIVESRLFPVIRHNTRTISFTYRFAEPGEHRLAIGATPYKTVTVVGEKVPVLCDNLRLSAAIVPAGESVVASADVINETAEERKTALRLFLNDSAVAAREMTLPAKARQRIDFTFEPEVGEYSVRIENSHAEPLRVYPHRPLDVATADLKTYISATARPSEFQIDQKRNRYVITASGTDFYHAEDSYAAVYIPRVKGNFVATLKVNGFGPRTHEWFRAGLFVRNDMTKSFDTEPGSKGSVLVFTTPGRAGMQWDEFGDGCMHKASSENLPQDTKFPVWLKLVRHGDNFSGYISLDGQNWTIERHTGPIPGIAEAVDLGLAAGSDNQVPYRVEFEEWRIEVEE